ncbi:organic cation transporter protein-like [Macrobrachium rosenbergii]|uniref:organic cation transporter protein-like n=1 Tax=Macrobrachium rosenbergii TaxID=79674 RepID=UPI0034D5D101
MTAAKFEDILTRLEVGPWHWFLFLLCSLWGIFGSMQTLATAFLNPAVDHWCHIPELVEANWTREQIWNVSMPRTKIGGVVQHSQCEMFVRNYTALVENTDFGADPLEEGDFEGDALVSNSEEWPVQPCSSWDYAHQTSRSTITSEWDLVCNRESLRSLIQSIFMLGVFFGSPLGGYFADRFGRKRLMTGSLWVFIVVSIVASFSPYYQLFLLCRFLMAFNGNIVYQTSYILAVEACTAKQRSIVGILFSVPFAIGYMLLPAVAYYVREWRHLHLAISLPVILLIANTILLPESPRWLIQTGKWSEAERELQRAARWNSRKSFDSTWLLSTIREMKEEADDKKAAQANREREEREEEEEEEEQYSGGQGSRVRSPTSTSSGKTSTSPKKDFLRKLFVFVRTPVLRRVSLIMSFNWITCTMVYYGLSLNFGNFSADPYLYMFLGGLMELPSYTLIIPVVMRIGRKIPLIVFLASCGVAVLVLLVLPGERNTWFFLAVVMVGKFLITSAYQVIYLYCSELYPTTLRTRGLGLTSMMGRLGAIISPFINDKLGGYHWAIPSTIFGILSMIAGTLTCLLPETNNVDLPETVADVENWKYRRDRKEKQDEEEAAAAISTDHDDLSTLTPASTSAV